jgi:hypothetical protein
VKKGSWEMETQIRIVDDAIGDVSGGDLYKSWRLLDVNVRVSLRMS